jgi:hypothetical protein
MQPCLSSSSNGLHTGQRVLTPASTSSSSSSSLPAWRYPAPRHHSSSSQQHRPQQQQCQSSPEDSQAFRFKHKFNPQQLSPDLGSSSSFGWPLQDGQRATVAGEGARLDPEQTFWSSTGPQDAVQLRNPWASKFRVKRVPMPVPVSLPGSEYWHVEMLNNYSTNWPSLKFVDGKLQFRKGFLEPFDDPKVGSAGSACLLAASWQQIAAHTKHKAEPACWGCMRAWCIAAAADRQQQQPSRLSPAHSCAVPLSMSLHEAQGGWAWEQETWYVTARCTAHLAARLLYSRHT